MDQAHGNLPLILENVIAIPAVKGMTIRPPKKGIDPPKRARNASSIAEINQMKNFTSGSAVKCCPAPPAPPLTGTAELPPRIYERVAGLTSVIRLMSRE